MRPEWCALACVREPAQCSLRHRGQRVNTGPWDVTCVSYWMGVRPLDYTIQDTGPRGAFCSRGVWGLPGCLSVRPAVKIHSFMFHYIKFMIFNQMQQQYYFMAYFIYT